MVEHKGCSVPGTNVFPSIRGQLEGCWGVKEKETKD